MYSAFGPNENGDSDTFQEMYPRSVKKKESNLGRRGMTERPIRLKTLLSKLDWEKLDEEKADEKWCNENGSLICANGSLMNSFDSSAVDNHNADSFSHISMEVEHGHNSCLSNSDTLFNNLTRCDSQGNGTLKGDHLHTYEARGSHTEMQNPGIKTANKMHEAMTHPPLKSVISFSHHSIISKDVMIQNNLTSGSSQNSLLANHSTNSKSSHKETKTTQLPPLMLNNNLLLAKSTLLKDVVNDSDIISRMRTPLKAINTLSYVVPVSESHISNANGPLLYNKENLVPAPLAPFTSSTPAKSESICGEYENIFGIIKMTGEKEEQDPITPLPGNASKPRYVPVSKNIKDSISIDQQKLDVLPTRFSNNIQASEVSVDLSLSSNIGEAVLSGIARDEISNAALHEVGSSSSEVAVQNNASQPQKDDGRYLLVNGIKYQVECLLGRGGSSKVYQVLHPDTSQELAIKCVNLSDTEPEIAQGYHNEIKLLKKLQGSDNIIRMFDYEYVPEEEILYVVLEKGGRDLSKLLRSLSNSSQLPISTVISYWLEMLAAVKSIHINGIIHSDLKPANFLIVNGHLKLIDFGIASSLQNGMTSVSKDIATGTFNYMSPEAIQDPTDDGRNPKIKINYKSDIWSLGCILYNLLYGKTPFQHIKQVWAKLATIKNCRTRIHYPPLPEGCPGILLKALKLCLQYDPKQRPSAEELQQLPYQCYLQMELLLNRIIQEIFSNSDPEDSVKALRALICKYQTDNE